MKKIFIFLLLFAAILGPVDSKDNADKWHTLTSAYGWSMRYPPDWQAYTMSSPEESGEPALEESDNVNFSGPSGCAKCGLLQVYFHSDKAASDKHSLDDYIQRHAPDAVSRRAVKIGKISGYRLRLPDSHADSRNQILWKAVGRIYMVTFGPNSDTGKDDPDLDRIFERMVGSLTFAEKDARK